LETHKIEDVLLLIAKGHLTKILDYDPYQNFPGVSDRSQFSALISKDPAFADLGLADERYIVARVGGNLVTSLHRKIGDMYEGLFQALLLFRFGLTPEQTKYQAKVKIGNRVQLRSTDGMIPMDRLSTVELPRLDSRWKRSKGLAFEVRSCYQIGDSKRIQADYDMALHLKAESLWPVMLVFCSTSLHSPIIRLSKSWALFQGEETFAFLRDLTGFDLARFMHGNSEILRSIIEQALSKI